MANEGDDTFMRITNRDIYESLQDLKKEQRVHKKEISEELKTIVLHQKETNGKIKTNRLMLYVGGVLILTLAGWLVQHLLSGV